MMKVEQCAARLREIGLGELAEVEVVPRSATHRRPASHWRHGALRAGFGSLPDVDQGLPPDRLVAIGRNQPIHDVAVVPHDHAVLGRSARGRPCHPARRSRAASADAGAAGCRPPG